MTKIDPGFLGAVFEALMNADFPDDDIPINQDALEFLQGLFEYHPDEQVRRWFVNELERINHDAGD